MAKNLLPVDALVATYLREGIQEAGLTYRQIATATGMSLNRVGIILRQEPPPATVGEIGLIASVLGARASSLVERAEGETRAAERARSRSDYDLVANDTINEYPAGDDADFDQA